ncbi:MAG: metallophosphoesterase [Calditrichaeota bacterium]|nr:MAG: metallophosphoesterase [Calditrichota bacterium]
MKVAIFSDIHDNLSNLDLALDAVDQCETLIFCGDFCAPFTLKHLADRFSHPIHVVFGNNDGDKFLLTTIATQHDHVTLHGEMMSIEIADLKIAANHYPQIARQIALAAEHNVVFYGHNHQHNIETVGETLFINPGEIMGRFDDPTFVIFDTVNLQVELKHIRGR